MAGALGTIVATAGALLASQVAGIVKEKWLSHSAPSESQQESFLQAGLPDNNQNAAGTLGAIIAAAGELFMRHSARFASWKAADTFGAVIAAAVELPLSQAA